MTFLALDLAASEVTAAVWSADGLVAVSRAPLAGDAGPRDWWAGAEAAVSGLSADLVEVEALGCAGTAETYVLLARDGEPLTVLGRSGDASVADSAGGAEDVRQRTGVLLDVRSVPARLRAVEPSVLARVGWVASGRDFVASLLTGRLASDPTVASASGFFRTDGTLDAAVVSAAGIDATWLPPQRGSTEVLGDLVLPAARRLGLRSRLPVVTGATRETCAVEGAGALPVAPLVTYGSPVVVSVPVEPDAVGPLPDGVGLRAGGRSYQVYEAALRGMTDALDGLVLRTGRDRAALAATAAAAAPGADPVRVAYEAVAAEVHRVVGLLAPEASFLYAAGLPDRAWQAVLPSLTGLPVVHRRSPEHVTLGLAMLTATGAGAHLDRDLANPVAYVDEPDPDLAGRYAAARG